MNKHALTLLALALILALTSACDSTQFSALNNPTATPSRTPRPTFTPRPSATTIPADTDTPEATATAVVTDTPSAVATDTATPKPTTKAAPKPVQPTQPPPPTQPSFPVYQDVTTPYKCDQQGVDEVTIWIKHKSPRTYAGGLWVGAFGMDGKILVDGAGKPLVRQTESEGSISYGSNCHNEYDRLHPDTSNGKIDVGDAVRTGTKQMIIRFVRGQSDYTPISKDFVVDFSTPGRWWIYQGYNN